MKKIPKRLIKELTENLQAQIDGFVDEALFYSEASDDIYNAISKAVGDIKYPKWKN